METKETLLKEGSPYNDSHSVGDVRAESPVFRPVQVLEVEIGQPLPHVSAGGNYHSAWALVRLHTQPLGRVELQLGADGLSPTECADQIWRALRREIVEHLRQDGLPEVMELDASGLPSNYKPRCIQERESVLANAPSVSIVIATHDRPASLATCLDSLLTLDYPNYEIIVVDNAPSTTATAELIRQKYPQVHYEREDYQGGSVAHNHGLLKVTSELVAFTDDDVIVDKYWLAELVRGFTVAEQVACVTGLIFPAELGTQTQMWIEQYSGSNIGFVGHIFDLDKNRPSSSLYPYTAGVFGSGANMAFQTSILKRMGGFDPALGPGSIARGGEELALFFKTITQGYKIVYQPAAIVHHRHPRDYVKLRQQSYNYGIGLTAYLTSVLIERPQFLLDFVVKIPYSLFYILNPRSPKNIKKGANYPKELTNLEWLGFFYGPIAYLHSRWRIRKMKRQPK